MIAPNLVVVMKAGPHGDEAWKPILRRKMDEERSEAGAIWWGYGGSLLDPRRQVRPLCEAGRVEVAMFETRSNPRTPGKVVASRYSTDQIHWRPLPNGVSVTGSTRALVMRDFRVVHESIDLSQYEVAIGRSARRGANDYFFDRAKGRRRRNDKACLRRRERDAKHCVDLVVVRAVLVEPFAVYLK